MTTPEDLAVLAIIAERSPEGVGVPVATIHEMGVADLAGCLAHLEDEGLIEAIGDRGEHLDEPALRAAADTVVILGPGWDALGLPRPR